MKQVETKTEIKMKTAIIYSVLTLLTLILSVGLTVTIEQYPDTAYTISLILLSVLGGMGVKRFLDSRRIK